MSAFLFRSGFAHAVITKRCSKTITWLLLSRLQSNKSHSRELSGTFWKLHPEPTPAHTGTLRNLPEAASGTYTSTRLRNLHQRHPGTFGNLPPEPSGTFLRNLLLRHPETLRNLLEPSSGTCSCDPHRHTPELIWAEDPISLRCWGKNFAMLNCFRARDVQQVVIRLNKPKRIKRPNSSNALSELLWNRSPAKAEDQVEKVVLCKTLEASIQCNKRET